MQKFTIGSDEAGQRMDKYLHKLLKNAPSSFYYKMLRKKNITLNGKKADGTELLQVGDEVSCFFAEETFEKFAGFAYELDTKQKVEQARGKRFDGAIVSLAKGASENGEISLFQKAYRAHPQVEIIYEDSDVLLMNKPMNLLSQQAQKGDLSANEWFLGYLLEKGLISKQSLRTFKPSVVNRLDRNTTGLLICGKSLRGSQRMSEIVRNRSVEKYYLAVVVGHFSETKSYDGFLVKDEKENRVTFFEKKEQIPAKWVKNADSIVTSFEPVKRGDGYTVLRVRLHTGKTHQIRAHLAALGHPILGDPKYGNAKANQAFHVKSQLLHAYELQFPQLEGMGLSDKTITCKPPKAFQKFMEA